jgi:hypothetical protein
VELEGQAYGECRRALYLSENCASDLIKRKSREFRIISMDEAKFGSQ